MKENKQFISVSLIIVFLFAYLKSYRPFLIMSEQPYTLSDWMLDVTGSLMTVFVMPLVMIVLCLGLSQHLWSGFGQFKWCRYRSRAQLLHQYIGSITLNASYIVFVLLLGMWLFSNPQTSTSALQGLFPFESTPAVVAVRLLTLWLTLLIVGFSYLITELIVKSRGIAFTILFIINGILYVSARDGLFLPWWVPGKLLFLPVYWQQAVPKIGVNTVYASELLLLYGVSWLLLQRRDVVAVRRKK